MKFALYHQCRPPTSDSYYENYNMWITQLTLTSFTETIACWISMKCILQNKMVPGSVSCDSNGRSAEWYLVEHPPNTEKIFFCWFNITRARHHKWAYNARCSGDRITARGMCLFLWTVLRQDNQLKTLRRRIIAEWQFTKPPATPPWCTYK